MVPNVGLPGGAHAAFDRGSLGSRHGTRLLVGLLLVLVHLSVHARFVTFSPGPAPYATGKDVFAVYTSDTGAPKIVEVDIVAGDTPTIKQNKIVNAMAAMNINAVALLGNQITVNGIDRVFWASASGEVQNGVRMLGDAAGEYSLELGNGQLLPSGLDQSGNPALYDLAFSGAGFLAEAQIAANQVAGGLSIDNILSALYLDLRGDLPQALRSGLYLDLMRDVIGFNPTGLFQANDSLEWSIRGGSNDRNLVSSISLSAVPEPTSWLLLATALLAMQGVGPRRKEGRQQG